MKTISAADAVAAEAAQARAQKADDRARLLAARADSALAEEEVACTAYRAATSRALAAQCTAEAARTYANRIIAIYTSGVSAEHPNGEADPTHPHYKAGGF